MEKVINKFIRVNKKYEKLLEAMSALKENSDKKNLTQVKKTLDAVNISIAAFNKELVGIVKDCQ